MGYAPCSWAQVRTRRRLRQQKPSTPCSGGGFGLHPVQRPQQDWGTPGNGFSRIPHRSTALTGKCDGSASHANLELSLQPSEAGVGGSQAGMSSSGMTFPTPPAKQSLGWPDVAPWSSPSQCGEHHCFIENCSQGWHGSPRETCFLPLKPYGSWTQNRVIHAWLLPTGSSDLILHHSTTSPGLCKN